MDGSPAPGTTSRVGTTDSTPVEARHIVYLFTKEWYAMSYVKESDQILFRPFLSSPMILEERDYLLSTQCLTFMMWQEIQRLIEPAIYARSASERLSFKLKRPVDLGTPLGFREVCENLEDLVMELDREVLDWKDRFFFDALEAHEDNLCSDCKESLRVAFRPVFFSEFLSVNGTHHSQIGKLGLFCSEFLSVNGTRQSQIGKLGLFCSEFLSVNGTRQSQIGKLGLFCSEFLSVNGTHCSQIGKLGLFCSEFLSVNGTHCSQIG